MRKLLVLFLILTAFTTSAFAQITLSDPVEGTASSTSTKVLDTNLDRKFLLIINEGATTLSVKAKSAHSGTEGVKIPSGGNWEPTNVPVDALYIKAVSGTPGYTVIQGQ